MNEPDTHSRKRFEKKFYKGQESECWNWLASFDVHGYGHFRFNGVLVGAHRISYLLYVGSPDGDVHHTCENRRCVNPAHLELKTRAEHTAIHHPLQTHCKHGHELTPENIRISPSKPGWRQCRECDKIRKRKAYKISKHERMDK